MNNHTTDATATATGLSAADARELGRSIVASIDQTSRIYQESPPEALLGALLRMSAPTHPDQAALEVRTRERLKLPTEPAATVEVDLLLRHPATGAVALIEVDGWQYHRRSLEEHDREIERDRRIRRCYPRLIRYAAGEVLRSPWGVLLDIHQHLDAWDGFKDVRMNPGFEQVAEACAAEVETCNPPVPLEAKPRAGSHAEALQQVGAALPPPPPTLDPALQQLRQIHPRMYAPWAEAEVAALRDAFYRCLDVAEIAAALGRTEAAVWAQLRRMKIVAE